MEAIFAQAVKDAAALKKTSVPWKTDEPYPQSYHGFDAATSSWRSKSPWLADKTDDAQGKQSADVSNIALFTWNIDFMLPFAKARMEAALAHLEQLTRSKSPSPTTAIVILLQECVPSDLVTIAATPWVRERFHLTDVDHGNWATTQYGTTMLIDSRLPIGSIFRVHYEKTRMDRDALFVDVVVGRKKLRICNTHLESMTFHPPFRPPQMQLVARFMHEDGVHAALAAGDFNAIQPFDRTLHVDGDNHLKDASLEMGGKEDTDEGFTWGQQAPTKMREQFGCSRMDKVYFCGHAKLIRFEVFGRNVLMDGEDEGKQIVALGIEKPWVTDHLGVMAEVELQRHRQQQL